MATSSTLSETGSSYKLKMKKKKQKKVMDSAPVLDLKSIIHNHSLFFDKLVELIPAKFYLPTDDKDKPWFQGLSKAAKASAKKESKENIKKARRDRLDPEKSSTTTLDLLKQSLEKEKLNHKNEDDGDDDDEEETDAKPVMLEGDAKSVTYEELRQRLHRKIEEFRAGRNTGCSNREKKRMERREKIKGVPQKKRKREDDANASYEKQHNSEDKIEKDVAEAAKELAFSHVRLGDEEKRKKKAKVSKLKELEAAKRLEEAKRDPEKGEIVTKKHSWKAAVDRAAGIKVHDDPKLLSKSIHKEKKRQQKSSEKWKQRVETTEKMKTEKQQKRSGNIAQKKHDRKMRKIAKREKKLMRPGFEGRKEGFINKPSTS